MIEYVHLYIESGDLRVAVANLKQYSAFYLFFTQMILNHFSVCQNLQKHIYINARTMEVYEARCSGVFKSIKLVFLVKLLLNTIIH